MATNEGSILQSLHSLYLWPALLALLILYYCISSIIAVYTPGLRAIPGPFVAKFSRWWNLRMVASDRCQEYLMDVHEKYGPIVRIGPWHVSLSDPSEIPQVLGIHSKMIKSRFYDVFSFSDGTSTLLSTFAERNPAVHSSIRSSVSQIYSMSSIRRFEPMVDECSEIFMNIMAELSGSPIDLGEWLQFYAFDVIGSMTFNKRLGFLEERRDVGGIIAGLDGGARYLTHVGQYPEWHPILIGSRLMGYLSKYFEKFARANPLYVVREFTLQQMERYEVEGEASTTGDFLRWMRQQRKKDGSRFSQDHLISHCQENVGAGSDTTAIALRAIFYFLVKNPRVYQKLIAEIDDMDNRGLLSPTVSFEQSLQMPYLQVVMKEAMRLHPSVGFLLDRVVPAGGATLCGTHIPAGTHVGINGWVVHRDRSVYGDDALEFRPERWLEASQEQLRIMDRTYIPFGSGTRTCLGKNISIMEMGKLVPQMLRKFSLEWSSPDPEWRIENQWFAKQVGVIFTLRFRKDKEQSRSTNLSTATSN